jgi:hypothetical protein
MRRKAEAGGVAPKSCGRAGANQVAARQASDKALNRPKNKKTPPKRGFLIMPEAVDQKRNCAEMP